MTGSRDGVEVYDAVEAYLRSLGRLPPMSARPSFAGGRMPDPPALIWVSRVLVVEAVVCRGRLCVLRLSCL